MTIIEQSHSPLNHRPWISEERLDRILTAEYCAPECSTRKKGRSD